MKKLTLLTSKLCGPCQMVKKKLEADGIQLDAILDYADPSNLEFFRTHNIKSVPYLIVEEEGKEVLKLKGPDDILAFFKN